MNESTSNFKMMGSRTTENKDVKTMQVKNTGDNKLDLLWY